MADPERPDDARSSRGRRPADRGWDDGKTKGSRPSKRQRPRRAGADGSAPTPADRRPQKGSGASGGASSVLARLPKWALPAAAVVVVLLLVAVFVLGRGGGSEDRGACLSELSHNLPRSATLLYGSDLVEARDAGYQDGGSLEDLGESQRTSGAIPDELTQRFRYGRLISTDELTAQTGVTTKEIDCSLSAPGATVMSGTFDPAKVNGSSSSNDGLLEATEDRLGLARGKGDPAQVLGPLDDGGIGADEGVAAVLTSLRDRGSYSVIIQVGTGDDDRLAGIAGLGVADADDGDDKALVVAWYFASEDAAQAGRTQVVERVNDALRGNSSITAADLEVEGRLVQAKISTRKAPDLLRLLIAKVDLIPRD